MLTDTPSLTRQNSPKPSQPLTIRRLCADDVVEAIDTWRSLEQRLRHDSITTSALWTETWLRYFGDLVDHEFLIAEAEGQTRGICLLTQSRNESLGPFPLRSVHLGTAGEPEADSVFVEYNRLLVEDEYRLPFCRGIIEHVDRDPAWDQFQLDGFAAEDAEAILQTLSSVETMPRRSPYFDLQKVRDENGDVITRLGRSTRASIRRQLRAYGDLTTEWVELLPAAEEVFSELVQLHQVRWQAVGKPGVFSSRRFHDFQLEVLTRGLLDRRVELFRARQGRTTIGCLLMLVDRNRLLGYLSGFAPFEKGTSPGLVTHYLSMEEALRRGYDAYDFLVGEHQHKQSLSNAENSLIWATWRRDRLKFRIAGAARRVKRTLRRSKSNEEVAIP